MLAYVFWHWPQTGAERSSYEQDLREFHRTLANEKPAGFQYSFVFRVRNAPWLAANLDAYEDWYVTDGSAALDVLNAAAVNSRSKQSHDRAAQRAAGGTAGLYLFRQGQIDFNRVRFANWFPKPGGMSYDEFYASLANLTSRKGVALWGRQMVLGPTTEFCLLSPLELPRSQTFDAVTLSLEQVWNGIE